jgi:hypothetical protein
MIEIATIAVEDLPCLAAFRVLSRRAPARAGPVLAKSPYSSD